jgi:hypothetical protein
MQPCLWLYLLGVGAEFAGIVLVGFPDALPYGRRLSNWMGRRWRLVENRLRSLVGLRRRTTTVAVGSAGTVDMAGRATFVVGTSATALDEQVAPASPSSPTPGCA